MEATFPYASKMKRIILYGGRKGERSLDKVYMSRLMNIGNKQDVVLSDASKNLNRECIYLK